MNREIKFRVWITEKGKEQMINDVTVLCNDHPSKMRISGDDIAIHPEYEFAKLMQYTGLKDKTGKEIYEGDIVKVLDRDWPSQLDSHPELNHQQYLDSISSICEIVYNQDRFEMQQRKGRGYFGQSLRPFHGRDVFEVIGNIYENPEFISP